MLAKVNRWFYNAGVKQSAVVPVPMNAPTVIEDVEVTLFDANHCPGAAMWLFRLKSGKVFLHVGVCRGSLQQSHWC